MSTFYEFIKYDEFVKSQISTILSFPTWSGIQFFQALMDSRLRGSDSIFDFLQIWWFHKNVAWQL